MAVVPGLKPALFFRAPGRSVLKGVGRGACLCSGRHARQSLAGLGAVARLAVLQSPSRLVLSRLLPKLCCVSGEADLSAASFQLNCFFMSSSFSSADNLCFEQIALKMSKLSISRIILRVASSMYN